MFKKPTRINSLFDNDQDPDLKDLLKKARRLADLNRKIQPCLPENLQQHCRVAALHEGQLTLAAESSAWATRIRFAHKQIKQAAMRRAGIFLNDIRVTIQQPVGPTFKQNISKRPTTEVSGTIQRSASAISDRDIREMFLEIASGPGRDN